MSNNIKNDLIKEYIKQAIEEKLKKRRNSNEIEASLIARLSKTFVIEDPNMALSFKKEIDSVIKKKINSLKNINDLQDDKKKQEVVDQLYNNFDEDKIKLMISFLENEKRENEMVEKMKFDANLILSEVFILDEEEKNKEDEENLSEIYEIEQSVLNISKFTRDFEKIRFEKLNDKKLFAFLEMLENYNFNLKFTNEEKEEVEGILLLLIYSNDHFLNNYIFGDFFSNFVKKFTKMFISDFESHINNINFFENSHFIFLCSYNPDLCHYLDRRGFFEIISQNFDKIEQNYIHIYLKIFVNFFKNHKSIIKKVIILKILDKFADKLITENNFHSLSLFLIVLLKISQFDIEPKNFLSFDKRNILFKAIKNFIKNYKEIEIFSFKAKKKPTSFLPKETEPFIISELYKKKFSEMILQNSTYKNYEEINIIGNYLLEFFSKTNGIFEISKNSEIVKILFNIINIFFYQKKTLKFGLLALRKYLNKKTLSIYKEEIINSHILFNILTVFERATISEDCLLPLENLLKLMIFFFENLTTEPLKEKNLKLLLDFSYKIRFIIRNYYLRIKKKYLKQGLLKFINKFTLQLKKRIILKLDAILELNTLFLQKLSHTHDIDINMNFYISEHEKNFFFEKSEKKINKKKIINILLSANKILYIVSKVDRNKEYINNIINFNINMLFRIEKFINFIFENKIITDFFIFYYIIEYLIINIYFMKNYDEDLKKISTVNNINKTIFLFVKIFSNLEFFLDFSVNYQIYILLENFNIFWLLFFDIDHSFYNKLYFVFLEKFEIDKKKDDRKSEYFSEKNLFLILSFFNKLVDLKSKCSYLNFIILKQIDLIFTSLTNISSINKKFIFNIFQKATDNDFSDKIHKINPKYLINYSYEFLSHSDIIENFMIFVFVNKLYLNRFVINLLKNCLNKNFRFESLPYESIHTIKLLKFTLIDQPLPKDPKFTKFLFNFAKKNLKNKNLFQDIIFTIKKHFKNTNSDYNKNLIENLFGQTGIFLKLVKLYKKDQVNLSKIMKYLLLISKKFNMFEKMAIPEPVLASILKETELERFQDIYIHIIDYILKRGMYTIFKEEIDNFYLSVKKYLDNCLFFIQELNYEKKIESIYYFLKVINHGKEIVKDILNIENSEYILKYILQIFDENYKMELTPVNNLYQYFNEYFVRDKINYDTLRYEQKIISLLLNVVKKNNFDEFEKDVFVINKFLSFCFYLLDYHPFEKYKDIYILYLTRGLKLERQNIFRENYYDFYLILFYKFNFENKDLKPILEKHIFGGLKLNKKIQNLLEDIKLKQNRFDNINYNHIIRHFLEIFYLLKNYDKNFTDQEYFMIVKSLDIIFKSYYSNIHEIHKFEKLLIDIYLFIHKKKKATSLNSSSIFLNIFSNKIKFKISSDINKFVYMDLFNKFFKTHKKHKGVELNVNTILIEKSFLGENKNQKKYKKLNLTKKILDQILIDLSFKELDYNDEKILLRFLKNVGHFKKNLISSLKFDKKMIDDKVFEIMMFLENFENMKNIDLNLTAGRLTLLKIYLNSLKNEENEKIIFEVFVTLKKVIKGMKKSIDKINILKKEDIDFDIMIYYLESCFKFLKKSYVFCTNKNDSTLKNLILNTYGSFFIKMKDLSSKNILSIWINSKICYNIARFMENIYDEVRICHNKELMMRILGFFTGIWLQEQIKEHEKEEKIIEEENEVSKIIEEEQENDEEEILEESEVKNIEKDEIGEFKIEKKKKQ